MGQQSGRNEIGLTPSASISGGTENRCAKWETPGVDDAFDARARNEVEYGVLPPR